MVSNSEFGILISDVIQVKSWMNLIWVIFELLIASIPLK